MEVLSIIESVSIIVASLGASITVVLSLNAWRREYIGKRKHELAEEVLTFSTKPEMQ